MTFLSVYHNIKQTRQPDHSYIGCGGLHCPAKKKALTFQVSSYCLLALQSYALGECQSGYLCRHHQQVRIINMIYIPQFSHQTRETNSIIA